MVDEGRHFLTPSELRLAHRQQYARAQAFDSALLALVDLAQAIGWIPDFQLAPHRHSEPRLLLARTGPTCRPAARGPRALALLWPPPPEP